MKLGHWADALTSCSEALKIEPGNSKAEIRRAQALAGRGDLAEAKAALVAAIKASPSNKTLRAEYDVIVGKIKAAAAAEKQMFGGALQNADLYSDKVFCVK